MEAIRFQVYDLEKSIGILWNSRERLRGTHLCVLVDGGPSPEEFDRRVSTLVDCGVDMIQLRDKELDDHQLWQRARLLVKRTAHHRALSIINDRADVAVAVNADGVHLGQEDLPIGAVRSILPADALVGISTHSIQQARQAVLDGADYLGAGPVFPSTTKSFEQLAGLEFLRQVVAEITLPTFAIGGIQPEHMEDVVGTGIARVAVSSAIPRTVDQIPQAVASLQTALPVRSPAWPS